MDVDPHRQRVERGRPQQQRGVEFLHGGNEHERPDREQRGADQGREDAAQHAPRGCGERAGRFFQVRVDAGERRVHALDRLGQEADQIGHDEDPGRAIHPWDVGVVQEDQTQAEDGARDRVADLDSAGLQRADAGRRMPGGERDEESEDHRKRGGEARHHEAVLDVVALLADDFEEVADRAGLRQQHSQRDEH